MNNKIIIGAACAALAASAAACSSGSSTAASGTETLSGTQTNAASSSVPITATGAVPDHGTLSISGNGDKAVFDLTKGNLKVTHSNGATHQSMTANCVATETTTGTYKVTGGTGTYQGATGHGDYTIVFTGTFPKTNGACANPSSANPLSGKVTFRASGPLTTG